MKLAKRNADTKAEAPFMRRAPAYIRIAALVVGAALAAAPAFAFSRVKDLVEVQGIRDNMLVGYGLVVGLNGTGDSLKNAPFTQQSIQTMLERLGTNTRGQVMQTKNVAAVMVTASLPAFAAPGTRIESNGISLDPGAREVFAHGKRIELTTFEFDILEMLMRSAGRVLSRDALMENFYNRKATPFDRSIDMHISHLRKKLEGGDDLIKTIRGVGYQFCSTPEDSPTE